MFALISSLWRPALKYGIWVGLFLAGIAFGIVQSDFRDPEIPTPAELVNLQPSASFDSSDPDRGAQAMAGLIDLFGIPWRMQADGSDRWILATIPPENRVEVGKALDQLNVPIPEDGRVAVVFRLDAKTKLAMAKRSWFRRLFPS